MCGNGKPNNEKTFCGSCSSRNDWNCRPGIPENAKLFYTSLFILIIFSFISAILSTIVTGLYFQVPVLVAFWIIYQLVIELQIHCPRCPFWEKDGTTINCAVNSGTFKPGLKLRRTDTERTGYNSLEKVLLLIFNYSSVIIPVIYNIMGLVFVLHQGKQGLLSWKSSLTFMITVIYPGVVARFAYLLFGRFCSRCINIECPMNISRKKLMRSEMKSDFSFKRTAK